MKNITLLLIGLISIEVFAGPTVWGPESGHQITEFRVYRQGEIILKIEPSLDTECDWNNQTITEKASPAYDVIASMALTAYTTGKKVRLLYDGCNGNVNLVGLVLLPSS